MYKLYILQPSPAVTIRRVCMVTTLIITMAPTYVFVKVATQGHFAKQVHLLEALVSWQLN